MTEPAGITALLMDGDRYPENPYMALLSAALEARGVDVQTADLPIVFPLTRTAVRNPDVDVLQVDWVYDYYTITATGYDPVDRGLSILRAATFLLDLVVVSLFSVAIVWTVHNERHHEGKYPRTERLVNELLFAVADAVTVKCRAAADVLAATYRVPDAESLHVVPDGNYISAYENEVSRTTAREDLSIADDGFVYLFFGLIREYKGIPELIAAFDALEKPDAELWIVGKPATAGLERELAALAAAVDGVETVFEFVPDDRIQYYLNAVDVLVLPYRRILNSGSVHLGLSYGTPIVAPARGCLPVTLPPENEFVYDPTGSDALLGAMELAAEHPDLESVGRANYEHALEQHWGVTAALLEDVYRRATGDSPATGARARPVRVSDA